MEPKFETIWSGLFSNDVARSNSKLTKMRIYIRVNNKNKWEDLSNSGKRIKWVDFEQTSWNTNSKLFEAAVCWTMWLTELNNKNEGL